ncbi:hypothetical protein FPS10_16965 [Pseudoruegeria sp. M32A2M]|nr:hypothetical protein [Pseudoruegeria sp. M32A2M]
MRPPVPEPLLRSGPQKWGWTLALIKRRNRIETMFGRLKGWRPVAIRYDRCPKVLFLALTLAETVMF